MDSLDYLEKVGTAKVQPIYVLHGDEDFLKRQVRKALRQRILGDAQGGFGLSLYQGDKAAWGEVHEELITLPFLGSFRLVVVEDADPFVSNHRPALEKYVAAPSATGVLALEVKTWPATTRLAKLLGPSRTLVCKALTAKQLPQWCLQWAASKYGKTLSAQAAQLLVDLIGQEMGQLDQELAKLATYVGGVNRVETADVDRLVGNSRAENTWKIFDAIGSGQTGAALALLSRLFEQGEEPIRLLGAFSMQIRRLAQAARLQAQGQPLSVALEQVGIPSWAARGCESQLRHMGIKPTQKLFNWLLEADQGLKGGSQLPARTLLERLVVKLAKPKTFDA